MEIGKPERKIRIVPVEEPVPSPMPMPEEQPAVEPEPVAVPEPETVPSVIDLGDANRIVVLTGAGISTESGIPDYRGPNGVWTRDPSAMRMSHISEYLADPEVRRQAWIERLNHPAWTASPNAGHVALADLERAGRLRALITQNIDGLHQAAGSRQVLELHGTIHWCRCQSCGYETRMQHQLDRVRAGDPDPACERCGGIQRSATIAFGQSLDEDVLLAAFAAAEECDLFIAVGTSLTVTPASLLCNAAKRAGAPIVIVNAQPTPYDEIADEVIRAPIGRALPALVT